MSKHASSVHDIAVAMLHIDQISKEEDVETSLHIQLSQQPAASTLSPDELRPQHHTNDTLEPSKGGFTRHFYLPSILTTKLAGRSNDRHMI